MALSKGKWYALLIADASQIFANSQVSFNTVCLGQLVIPLEILLASINIEYRFITVCGISSNTELELKPYDVI